MVLAAIAAALMLWFWLGGRSTNATSTSPGPAKAEYAYSASTDGQLFRSTPGRGVGFAPTPTTDAPPDPILISRDAARQAVSSGVLQVTLPNRITYPVRFERQETSPSGDWTFVGRVNTRIGKLAAVLTFGRAGVFGVLPAPDGRMLHIVTNHGQAFIQPAGGLVPVGTPAGAPPNDVVVPGQGTLASPAPVKSAPVPAAVQSAAPPPTRRAQPALASTAALTRIDVLGVYTTNLVALRGSVAAAESEFTNLIAVANQAHVDSGTVARLRLVAMRQVDYSPGSFNYQALDAITGNTIPGVDVYALRDAHAADLVAMLRPYAQGDDSCGIAYINAPYSSSETGFSVTATESCGPLVLAHEIGHNLGSHHDTDTTGGAYGAYPFSRGYRQHGPPAFATVMAYAEGTQSWIGFFSNPRIISCMGVPCGVEDQADNVRSIGLMAGQISRFRDPLKTISVLDADPVFEPDSGQAIMTFEVRLSSPAPAGGVRFDISTGGTTATATAGTDYVGSNLTNQLIPEGQRSYHFHVRLLPDMVVESDETIRVSVRNVSGMAAFDASAFGTIRNDDPRVRVSGRILVPGNMEPLSWQPYITACSIAYLPGYTIECASTQEGTDTFSINVLRGAHVTLHVYPGEPYAQTSFDLGILDAHTTYDIQLTRAALVSGRVTWPAGEPAPSGTLQVTMESPYPAGGYLATSYYATAPDYAFRFGVMPGTPVALSVDSPPAPYVRQLVELPTVNGDTTRNIELRRLPSIAIGHAAVWEDEASLNPPLIRIRLSAPAPAGGVRFKLATADGSAMSDNDYGAKSVSFSIPEGSEFSTVDSFSVRYDPWREADESFKITARNVVGAWLPGNGSITILNDDTTVEPRWVFGSLGYDHFADIVWRNPTTGGVSRWDGPFSGYNFRLGTVTGSSWKIVGIGDFDNDRVGDLMWRNSSSGRNTIWLMGDVNYPKLMTAMEDARWTVAGVGDFNGDARSDVLWRHTRSGSNAIWRSANSTTLQNVTAVTNLDWTVAGIGDFDGDGADDLLWRNGRTGANVIWRSANHASQLAMTSVSNVDWTVVGVGDFNADRQSDIMWRNRKTGANVIWLSAASSRQRAVAKVTDLDWQVEAVADYDGDGHSDLFWRHQRLGSNAVWLSGNSATRLNVSAVHPTWQVAP